VNQPRIVAVIAASALLVRFCYADEPTDPKHDAKLDALIAQSTKSARESEEFAKKLLQILTNKEQPLKDRLAAARALGKLQYAPAIPKLIENIDLEDPETLIFDDKGRRKYRNSTPTVNALGNMGLAAIPKLVEAALVTEEGSDRRVRFLEAIRRTNHCREAALYAQGLAFDTDDAKARKEAAVLIRELVHLDPNIPYPPPWLKTRCH
jgi:HEAT repeat protein